MGRPRPSRALLPVGLGEAVRQLAALCAYPGKRARFHACYYDLKEDEDYIYLSVPIRACGEFQKCVETLQEMGPIQVQVYGELGKKTESKRILPLNMQLTRFPAINTVADACLINMEDVNKAITACSASLSAG